MLAGERFSDHPVSVCPIIGALLRAYNDEVDEPRRHDLYRYAAESVGTRGSHTLQLRRAQAALAWARSAYEQRGRLRRRPTQPRPDHGPDEIAFYVVRSLGRRHTDESHAAVLALLDELVGLSVELFEQRADLLEDGGCSQELVVAELRECSTPARLLASASLVDHCPAAIGE
jgi:hypothetical protein